MPLRARAIVAAVALAIGLTPLALARPARSRPTRSTLAGLIAEGAARRASPSRSRWRALFAAVAIAGALLDTLDRLLVRLAGRPDHRQPVAVLSQLYALVGVAGLHRDRRRRLVIAGLARTYDLVPLTALPALARARRRRARSFATIFVSALEVAAPVLIALVITDAALRRRLARRAAAERLLGRLAGQDRSSACCRRRVAAVRRRLDRRPAAAVGRTGPADASRWRERSPGEPTRPRRQHPSAATRRARRARSPGRSTSTARSSCSPRLLALSAVRRRTCSPTLEDAMAHGSLIVAPPRSSASEGRRLAVRAVGKRRSARRRRRSSPSAWPPACS